MNANYSNEFCSSKQQGDDDVNNEHQTTDVISTATEPKNYRLLISVSASLLIDPICIATAYNNEWHFQMNQFQLHSIKSMTAKTSYTNANVFFL